MTTVLLLAAALALGQSEAATAQARAPQSPAAPQASVVVPTARPQTQTPADGEDQAASQAPAQPAASTEPQQQLEQQSTVRPFEMPAASPGGPASNAEATDPKSSVKVEDYHRSYEGPKNAVEAYYDAGVRNAFQAEQALHGGLDGAWVVAGTDGAPILSLVISDPGAGQSGLGGAWRDLGRPNDATGTGLIEEMVRDGRSLTVRIRLHEGEPAAVLQLTQSGDGRWRGKLQDAGASRVVVMDRKPI